MWMGFLRRSISFLGISWVQGAIESHLREVLPQYNRGTSEDAVPDNYACSWKECCWDSPLDAGDLIRHVFFHAFHTKIKVEGFKKQKEMNLSLCTLDSQSRNLIPENTEPFLCEWKECSVEFNCPSLFYRHVDSHALAVDKSLFEIRDDGRKKYVVTCQWEGKGFPRSIGRHLVFSFGRLIIW